MFAFTESLSLSGPHCLWSSAISKEHKFPSPLCELAVWPGLDLEGFLWFTVLPVTGEHVRCQVGHQHTSLRITSNLFFQLVCLKEFLCVSLTELSVWVMWSLFFIDELETPVSGIQLPVFLTKLGHLDYLFSFLSSPKGMPIEYLERGDGRERAKEI